MNELGLKAKAFLAANVLLTLIAAITLIGTVMPILTSAFTAEPVSVGPAFYNIVVGPLAVLLLAVMATGPLLRDGAEGWAQLRRAARVPLAVAGVVVAVVALTISINPWALSVAAIVAFAVTAIATDFIARLRVERGRDPRADALRMIDGAHWRYGGQLAHLGMVMILLGVIGSSLFAQKQTLQMKPGETASVGGYTLTYRGIEQRRQTNYTAVQAHIEARKSDKTIVLNPQMRFYDKAKDAHAEVALRTNLREDLYVTLAGWEEGGRLVAVQAIVNPLVLWIWIGGVTLVLGAVMSLAPRLLPRRASAPAARDKRETKTANMLEVQS
jgi:cytochrome c-type biogenesis protein CcmF